jgi:hypothetical protein
MKVAVGILVVCASIAVVGLIVFVTFVDRYPHAGWNGAIAFVWGGIGTVVSLLAILTIAIIRAGRAEAEAKKRQP